jgi:hypothetical protein
MEKPNPGNYRNKRKFEIDLAKYEDGTYNVSFEGPSMDLDKIEQSYKSFKNPKDALLYAGELAKANRNG